MDARDEAGYADFVRAQWPALVRAAVFLGADPDEAQDLAQLTLVKCYGSWQRVTDATNQDAYVYRMLVNQLRDVRRTPWWRTRVDSAPDGSIADSSERFAVADAVQLALAGLTTAHRQVVVLRYFVHLSELQTAAALGISPGTVKSRLSRALGQLAASRHLIELSEERR